MPIMSACSIVSKFELRLAVIIITIMIFFSLAQLFFSFLEKRKTVVASFFSVNWKKINNEPICFGAGGDSYGTFNIIENGSIYTFKLVHLHGSVRCHGSAPASYWGCTHPTYGDKQLGAIITFANKTALQLAEYRGDGKGCGYYSYKLDKVAVNASILQFNNLPSPLAVYSGQEFQVWFGRDLYNCGERTNSGQMCIDGYAWYA